MDLIGPLERVLLQEYSLKTTGRQIVEPVDDPEKAAALELVDQNSRTGDQDGITTVDEWRNYLSWISVYDEKDYWNDNNYLVEQVLPEVRQKLAEIGDVVGIKAVDPFYDPEQRLENYTRVNLTLLFMIDHPEYDQELFIEATEHGEQELNNKNHHQLFEKFLAKFPDIIDKISDQAKWEYLNTIINHHAFLDVRYSTNNELVPKGILGDLQSPLEIFQNEQTRIGDCFELASLAVVMSRSIGLSANIYELKLALNKNEFHGFNGKQLNIPEIIHHAVAEITVEGQKILYDPPDYSLGNESFNRLTGSTDQYLYREAAITSSSYDQLTEIANFYLFSAENQVNSSQELKYNDKLVEMSFAISPFDPSEEYYYFTALNLYSSYFYEPLQRSSLFLEITSGSDWNDPNILAENYLSKMPYDLRKTAMFGLIAADNYQNIFTSAVNELELIQAGINTYFIEINP